MELHHVTAFLAVAEELHFGRAAARLHMAQPPLSRTIRQLERQLGTPLFERTTRSVRLTPQGAAFVDPAREIVRAVETAERTVTDASSGEIGEVRVGFAGPSSHRPISQLARRVRRDLPGIELSLTSTTYGSGAIERIVEGSLDLAVVMYPSVPAGLESRVVALNRFVVVLSEDHRLAGRDAVAMADLADEPWVMLEPSTGSTLREITLHKAQAAGYVPRVAQHAPDSWAIFALVAAGLGVTLTVDTAFGAGWGREGLVVIPLSDSSERAPARLLWRTGDSSPALRQVLDLSEQALPTPSG
ncbi:LysR substrate-binding domain-containing protein [Janibacter sp. Y6]|uniref:LysR family transcriptional regulator n=1 Tax=Janibacter sp. Y6 TaxID=2913552 RepID=UPI0034A3F652